MNKNKEIKIALMAVVGLFILYIGMNFLKGASLFSSDDLYFAKFSDVTGLSESSPIYADGFKVGTVKSIEYDYNNEGNIKVGFSLDDRLRLAKGSSAEIVSDMLGNVRINLLLANNPRERVKPGEVIVGVVNNGAMAKAAEMIPEIEKMLPKLDFDFSGQPDLTQTFAVTCAMMNMPFHFTGLSTLRIKETDRIEAIEKEMRKLGYVVKDANDSELIWDGELCEPTMEPIDTYEDHRMAMAFAAAAIKFPGLMINNPEVVTKSYPDFWEHMKQAGFTIEEIDN